MKQECSRRGRSRWVLKNNLQSENQQKGELEDWESSQEPVRLLPAVRAEPAGAQGRNPSELLPPALMLG